MIRLARRADAEMVRACAQAAFARYVPRMGRAPAPMQADIIAAINLHAVHIATNPEGALLGYVICRAEGVEMRLDTVAVWPDSAGQGIGRRLIAHVEALARDRGLQAVTLYTNAAMTETLRVYPALGYFRLARSVQDGFDRVSF